MGHGTCSHCAAASKDVPSVQQRFSSVQFKTVSMRSEKPICAPPLLSEYSPTLPLKQQRDFPSVQYSKRKTLPVSSTVKEDFPKRQVGGDVPTAENIGWWKYSNAPRRKTSSHSIKASLFHTSAEEDIPTLHEGRLPHNPLKQVFSTLQQRKIFLHSMKEDFLTLQQRQLFLHSMTEDFLTLQQRKLFLHSSEGVKGTFLHSSERRLSQYSLQ